MVIAAGCASTSQPESQPMLKAAPSAIDFGTVDPRSGVRQAKLTLQNTGNRPLAILNVATSCGCTESSAEKNILAPGETTPLDVRFDPAMHTGEAAGDIYHLIYVQTDDPAYEEIEIEMRAFIQPNTSPQ